MLAEFAFGFSPSILNRVSPFLRILNPSFYLDMKGQYMHVRVLVIIE